MAYEVDREWVAEWVRRTRAEQGLPPVVEDPVVLATIADLVRPYLVEKGFIQPGNQPGNTPVRRAS